MDQIYLYAGLYGFSGSILIVLFKIWPDIIDWKLKKKLISDGVKSEFFEEVFKNKKFFPDPNEKTYEESKQTYDFYSILWSFRLIGTSFIITIFYSIFPSEFLGLTYNAVFVLSDVFLLTFFSLFGIEDVRRYKIGPRGRMPIAIIFGFNLFIYGIVWSLNFSIIGSTRTLFVDNILIISTAISQTIFTLLFFGRYSIKKHKIS